ncbi:glycerophosphodiester phosphodiesterase family protein [Mariniflexile sp.]|uniref:glycerophosphodiester phosphodiesterase family protein n=1 Tax=Mariniflexile sp. TaxID=1979402 RepID=UPI00404726D2
MKKSICLLSAILLLACPQIENKQVSTSNTKNIVIAHRGAWKTNNLPQNSIASLKEAIKLGCYGSEFDVHLTKDDIMVVNHDKDFMGIDIETSTYEELLDKKLSNGEKIPTLKAYLEEGLKQDKTKLILEIKTAPSGIERTLKLTKMAVELVHSLNGQSMVEYICFNFEAGKLVRELDLKTPIAYLNGDLAPKDAKQAGYTSLDYNIKIYRKNPEWIKEAHNEGITINVWTVNSNEDMKEMIKNGVDFITTNEPEKLFELINNKKNEVKK